MSNRAIARRYASALYAEASSSDAVDGVDADIALVQEVVGESRELRLLLASPVVGSAKKAAVISRLFEPHVSGLVLAFLLLINEKRREGMLTEILDSYRALRLEQQGIVEAHARVAVEMTDDEQEELRASFASKIGSKITLAVEQDPSLIGGLVVKIGDKVYDGSLKRKLAILRRQLEGGSFHSN